jgi:hypothetical protein
MKETNRDLQTRYDSTGRRVGCAARHFYIAIATAAPWQLWRGAAQSVPRLRGLPLARRWRWAASSVPGYVWWEAENPGANELPAPGAARVRARQSRRGGGAVGGPLDRRERAAGGDPILEYDVRVAASAEWRLYARKFWQHGPFRWRFNNQPWQQVGKNVALLDNESLRQFVGANWVYVGAAKLPAGTHRLRIELTENEGAAAFDAFLVDPPALFAARQDEAGRKVRTRATRLVRLRAGSRPVSAEPIDLRSLNETVAGQNGFIRVKNGQFVHGKTGQPVRFWAVNAGPGIARMDKASVDHLARFLAKRGVNMVRYHGPIYEGSGPNLGRVDPEMVDKVHYFVAAMKRQGIYTNLSIYFPLWVRLDEKHGWPGYQDRIPFAVLFFNPDFQKMYRGWWRTLLTTRNPYTAGTPLNRDPAVAALEMVNEDSYFFWTFTPYENLPAPQMAILEKQFGDWLAEKYGSVEKALAAWGSAAPCAAMTRRRGGRASCRSRKSSASGTGARRTRPRF